MTGTGPGEPLARAFEEQRPRSVAVAHRMLGSRADAEDAVQETKVRTRRSAPAPGLKLAEDWSNEVYGVAGGTRLDTEARW
ncbi:sigma factor [Actinoplanes auranticolor]|uniref:RNA polymerase sigma-70 region 2 domain-containing protein n=1 Tax=Actinoplanes auranticolor TaxID=47988 RepID=A0A919S5W0_9ACTN|nr:hypothetical protein Aau02nite_20120 [Actinoplanes auranticolor]